MDLAISATTPGMGVREMADLCAYAEDLGYSQAWEAEVAGPDPFVLAAAIASRTRRMDIGVAASPVYTRTPVVLATAALSVSSMLGGRSFHLGLGSSSEIIVSQWHGVEFSQHLLRVRETVEAIRGILNGINQYEGRILKTHRFRPALNAEGPVLLWIAALRPRMLALAGAVADGVCLNLMPARVVRRQLEAVEMGAREAGRTRPAGVMARLQVLVTADPGPARKMLRFDFLGPYLAQPVYNRFLAWMGYEEEARAIADAWARRDREALAGSIPDRLVEDLALIGSRTQVRDRLSEFDEAGVTVAALSVLVPERRVVEETLRALAP